MPIVDLIAAAFLVAMAAWGGRAGVAGTIVPACFAAGAVAGALLAPLTLDGGRDADFALAVAFPAALLAGAVLAAVAERWIGRVRPRADRARSLGAIGGALLALWTSVVVLWLAGAAAAQVGQLRDRVEDSIVVGGVESVLSSLGPRDAAQAAAVLDPFPVVAGSGPPIAPVDPAIVNDPDVRRADRSVVRISAMRCGRLYTGSGWIGRAGVVVTNAHVVEAADVIRVRLGGKGLRQQAQPIWFDPVNDVALLRVAALRAVPALAIVRAPREGVSAAALGFPAGHHAIRAARLGPTTDRMSGRMRFISRAFPQDLKGRLITAYRARTQGGSSGGPIVDARGRVVTTVFGGLSSRRSGLGIPNRFVRSALRRAGPEVDTGSCPVAADASRGR